MRRTPIGRTRCRMYATHVAMASSSNVIAAELISPRIRWKAVADTITTMIPTAAHVISHGRILVRPGRVSPTAASTSATPRKIWNRRGSDAFICAAISGGGGEKEPAVSEERNREQHLHDPDRDVHDATLPPLPTRRTRSSRSTYNHTKKGT